MRNDRKKYVNAAFGLLGAGALGISYYAASHSGFQNEVFDDSHPNPGLNDGTYVVENPSGPVRSLTLTVNGGRIVNVDVSYNDHNRTSHQLNTAAVTQLRAEVLDEQSADDLDLVTGATATSAQFVTSLQAAIDRARG